MRHLAIVYKPHAPEAKKLALELKDSLAPRGLETWLWEAAYAPDSELPVIPPETDLAVVMGGDGTMLGAVRALVNQGLEKAPVLGVNLGGLGFLTALSPEELNPALDMVLKGDYICTERLMLEVDIHRNGKPLSSFDALNDVVINKAALARIVELPVYVDGHRLTAFRADGLIIATPTGSSAYNLSAGGPICHPGLDCILVTPICSFALSNRPLLLDPDMTITLRLDDGAPENHPHLRRPGRRRPHARRRDHHQTLTKNRLHNSVAIQGLLRNPAHKTPLGLADYVRRSRGSGDANIQLASRFRTPVEIACFNRRKRARLRQPTAGRISGRVAWSFRS